MEGDTVASGEIDRQKGNGSPDGKSIAMSNLPWTFRVIKEIHSDAEQ
jgi:hypothetical protein